tara:strand:+ start:1615 stop:1833 length:219 start_codon:yes stop_codon:yes gene_type:complete
MKQIKLDDILTLDNIYKYASDEELSAIVHSILNRFFDLSTKGLSQIQIDYLTKFYATDKEIAEIVRRLRTPQ